MLNIFRFFEQLLGQNKKFQDVTLGFSINIICK